MDMNKEQVSTSLQTFVSRRDSVLHDDNSTFDYALKRFLDFLQKDELTRKVFDSLPALDDFDVKDWWQRFGSNDNRHSPDLLLPDVPDEELVVRYKIITSIATNNRQVFVFGMHFGKGKRDEAIEIARSILLRPFAEEFGNRMARVANLVTPQERALQAVPLNRIPHNGEIDVFLSHKTVDKPLVYRYYHTLRELGFSPWLDDPNMPAGTNLERGIFKGFAQSCAAVFFITDNFKDESYLATEVDYAVMQKRKKGNKFAIITLRYSNAAPVPDLLTPYTYKTVENDLDGFRELIRALPIELGPIRWKIGIIEDEQS